MPITEQIYQMLFCGKSAQEVALSLLGRERKRRIRRKMTLEVWQHIRQEAKELAECEPMLASFFHSTIFKTSKSWQCLRLFTCE